ncbi:hypothetical protein Slin15195_G008570 [Septoria linicola]|uniref:PH domain-containing protein n=1 Tax=Septoria linicola TaxID=215465 RepID=A0A9Q9EFR9_9PEZI|nr:hypothetical protein Slin14017_G008580 [Septoria linicola]USW47538.1 hypothetical protein Slin15195_G008570 [Septoria linicola]
MAPATLTTSGADLRRRTSVEVIEGERAVEHSRDHQPVVRPARSARRATSYHPFFQTSCSPSNDEPPNYLTAVRAPSQALRLEGQCREQLPKYSCTVGAEGKLLLNLESINPLHGSCEGEWREVYVVIRGTMICFHRVKDGSAGKLLRSYTLQHAEVGLASDSEHTVLVPQTRLAHLIPSSARRRAWQKDPDLFRPVGQHILRLRVETDQILLADSCEDRIYDLVNVLSAGIDISHAIDERSVPRQCTVPRRRRRNRPQFNANVMDPVLVAEQERIFRQMYPGFAGAPTRPALPRSETQITIPQTPGQEEDEVDFSMMREEIMPNNAATPVAAVRPSNVRQTTSTTINSVLSVDMMYATPTTNFSREGKWQPPHMRTAAQEQRYIRRCMPTLNADATRASDILIVDGRRMRLNWRMELFEQWELQPPTYKSHDFSSHGSNIVRASSQRSSTASAAQAGPQSSSSILGDSDQILPLESSLDALHLTKVVSTITTDKGESQRQLPTTDGEPKSQYSQQQTTPTDVHGVVFCF